MKLKMLIDRYDDCGTQTLSVMYVLNQQDHVQLKLQALELPWKNNERHVSCIPAGEYLVVKHTSPKFGKCFWVKDVPARSEILIHSGNYHRDVLGCILPGKDLKDINKDGKMDVTESKKALKKLLDIMPLQFNLKIVNT